MYLRQQKILEARLRLVLREKFAIELETLAIEQPPEIKFGEYALPLAFELARQLRKAPRKIAEEIIAALGPVEGFTGFEVAGAGYINARLNRAAAAKSIAASAEIGSAGRDRSDPGRAIVEHTSINPNKAAHVGHLRNAILGDTFVRLLRAAGEQVDVQNYIDNTGVQVADILVGLQHLENKSPAQVESLLAELKTRGERIDYYCWNLYARVSQWYDEDAAQKPGRVQLRLNALHDLERGNNETSEIAELISTAILRRHLETMLRLGIEYDFLPRESEILRLNFWDSAFQQLRDKAVLYKETEGKNKGCWVMRRPNAEALDEGLPDEDAKVIVRSNGTVTYVGKDIAYHLWKFGLLGRDFGYKKFREYRANSSNRSVSGHGFSRAEKPQQSIGALAPQAAHTCWISTTDGEPDHPNFGHATAIYNVIDSRQSDPQSNVIEALRGLGYAEQAARYTHFSYEMVALTPRCALELGYTISEEDRARPYIEVSGRKGFGVKADDLLDKLIEATQAEVDQRHPELPQAERARTANAIAVGALRYFMLKYTRNSVIAFDFKDALSFEGETGPYIQYAVVRTRSIFRKAETTPEASLAAVAALDPAPYLAGEENEAIWRLWLRASKTSLLLDQCIATAEPAYLAKHAFQLAQDFSDFYRKHHILTEADPARRTFLLATAAVAQRELIRSLDWLGIEAPEIM